MRRMIIVGGACVGKSGVLPGVETMCRFTLLTIIPELSSRDFKANDSSHCNIPETESSNDRVDESQSSLETSQQEIFDNFSIISACDKSKYNKIHTTMIENYQICEQYFNFDTNITSFY